MPVQRTRAHLMMPTNRDNGLLKIKFNTLINK